eukprot:1816645-Rhodomonas_salina.1
MHVVLDLVGHVVVDDHRHVGDVDPTCAHVRRDQDLSGRGAWVHVSTRRVRSSIQHAAVRDAA